MAAVLDLESAALVALGAGVAVSHRDLRERGMAVQLGQETRVALEDGRLLGHAVAQPPEDLGLEARHALLGIQDLLLILFELRRDVSLRIDERLLADVVVRDLILARVGDLEVVAEDLVEADLEGRDAGSLRLFLLHTDQPVFAGACDTPELVELFVEPIADKASLTHAGRWVIHQGAPDFADEIVA